MRIEKMTHSLDRLFVLQMQGNISLKVKVIHLVCEWHYLRHFATQREKVLCTSGVRCTVCLFGRRLCAPTPL
jgi:hypothetical protein